jgi:hypothetical protein
LVYPAFGYWYKLVVVVAQIIMLVVVVVADR